MLGIVSFRGSLKNWLVLPSSAFNSLSLGLLKIVRLAVLTPLLAISFASLRKPS